MSVWEAFTNACLYTIHEQRLVKRWTVLNSLRRSVAHGVNLRIKRLLRMKVSHW